MTPLGALDLLKAGNIRFLANALTERDIRASVERTAGGQSPFAVILSCVDSRTAPEILFDRDFGEILCIRVAGNVLGGDVLGSMELACTFPSTKLIVVMGHSSCGAIRGACEGVSSQHMTGMLEKIAPAIETVESSGLERGDEFFQRVSDQHVANVVQGVQSESDELNSVIAKGRVGLVGAMYSLQTGAVTFGDLIGGSES